jgi:ATP-dependent Lhr-like helicase
MTAFDCKTLPPELEAFHPALARWFAGAFGEPTPVQREAWEAIRTGHHVLIAAPTGSGKTLAALLPCLDHCVRAKSRPGAEPGVKVVYVTPLKALNNDIHHHIVGFAEAIDRLAAESGEPWPGLRAAVRTGDTTAAQRAAMLRRPPDVLVTTPESLYILLLSEKGRRMLRTAEHVIVDEIHDLAADRRGAHLSLTLERLAELCPARLRRIGVSATQKPLARVARFLAGWEEPRETLPDPDARGEAADVAGMAEDAEADEAFEHPYGYRPRPVRIVESRMERRIELTVTMPDQPAGSRKIELVWKPIVERLLKLMEGARSVIVFVNSRRLAERLTLHLNDHAGYEMSMSHHGSVSRERRLEIERRLKSGDLRVIVATSSLELGIDVGHVDLVIQLDSPLSAAGGIQRFGRAGHAVGGVSRGAIVARARDQLPEIAVLAKRIVERDIEPIEPIRDPLDVLSQHVVAMAAASSDPIDADTLHRLIVRSDSFRSFPPERLHAALLVLGGHYPFARPLIEYDGLTGRIARRGSGAMAALTGAGTIPSSSAYPVHHAETRVRLGELDEEYIEESRVGDVFQLGTSSWRIQSIRQDRVYAVEAGNRYSEIPFWRNEGPGRSYELGQAVGRLWAELERRLAAGGDAPAAGDAVDAGTAPGAEDASDAEVAPGAEDASVAGAASGTGNAVDAGTAPGTEDASVAGAASGTGNAVDVGTAPGTEDASVAGAASGTGNAVDAGTAPGTEDVSDAGPDARTPAAVADGTAACPASSVPAGRKDADADTMDWLSRAFHLDGGSAAGLVAFFRAQQAQGGVPTDRRLIIEYYRDVTGRWHIALLNHWGKRVNRTWLLAIRHVLERTLGQQIYAHARDGGIELVLPEWGPAWLEAVRQVTSDNVERLLTEAIPGSPLFGASFRRIAETSLLLQRSFRRTPMWQKRIRSEELLREALPYADRFPYLQEAMRRTLREELDLPNLLDALRALENGEVRIVMRETAHPSPLAAAFVSDYAMKQLYEGDQLSGDLQMQLIGINRKLAGELFGEDALRRAVRPEAVEDERRRLAEPGPGGPPADADGLYALLKRRGDSSAAELAGWAGVRTEEWLAALERDGRAVPLDFGGETRWICADELDMYREFPETPASIAFVAGRWTERVLSFTLEDLISRYPRLSPVQARAVVDELLLRERIEPSPIAGDDGAESWMNSRTAARILRRSVREARREAEPLEPERWLLEAAALQHALPGTRLAGESGLLAVIRRLQGLFLPLELWETAVFPSRLNGYRGEWLDALCGGGEVFWIARGDAGSDQVLVAFFLAESRDLWLPALRQSAGRPVSHPELLDRLRDGGAAFLTKLARETDRLPSELLSDLLDLARDGHVSNDQFAPLRLALSAKPPKSPQTGSAGASRGLPRTGSGQGRWYALSDLLREADAEPANAPPETAIMAWTRHLLDGFGILAKETAEHWSPFGWDALLPVLRQLEEMGVVTRGPFVRDAQTMQFVPRDRIDALRRPPVAAGDDGGVTVLAASDPANPFGMLAPWPGRPGASFARRSGNFLVLRGGDWLLWIEGYGKNVFTMRPPEAIGAEALTDAMRRAFRAIMQMARRSKIRIACLNGEPAAESAEAAPLLRAIGAERDARAMTVWLSSLGR